uniref:DUF834 domain-containing protein n=1 Tax=Oryza meridionalis TaxID=40149 RepID=A0A0E0CNP3_9ORYZ
MGTMGGSWPESGGRGEWPEMREGEAVDQREGKVAGRPRREGEAAKPGGGGWRVEAVGRPGMEGEAADKSKPAGKGIIPCDWRA